MKTRSTAVNLAWESSMCTDMVYKKPFSFPVAKQRKFFPVSPENNNNKKKINRKPTLDISFFFLQWLLLVNRRCSLPLTVGWEERKMTNNSLSEHRVFQREPQNCWQLPAVSQRRWQQTSQGDRRTRSSYNCCSHYLLWPEGTGLLPSVKLSWHFCYQFTATNYVCFPPTWGGGIVLWTSPQMWTITLNWAHETHVMRVFC